MGSLGQSINIRKSSCVVRGQTTKHPRLPSSGFFNGLTFPTANESDFTPGVFQQRTERAVHELLDISALITLPTRPVSSRYAVLVAAHA
ncbi:hypothetical protein RRU01S_29_00400 [Agrobacterium rubi TR3 = NBRC 13261]|uniref:Uncharacterized protein n=1 Tax=Agrobacterium rubi TR3 = NBRC 13261 TaxID=1368415 RepID=A0A081D1X7_9HYPH|nr:hypothetical protein [Agrobacterium rubi]GAK72923.1 hypothetical protein RRU01S_29_00400 [Agrobacterium rubi TR3 = NBRC 13261]